MLKAIVDSSANDAPVSKGHKNSKSELNPTQLGGQGKSKMIIDLRPNKQKNQSTRRGTGRPSTKLTGGRTAKLQGLPSTREYCIIKGKFVPLECSEDRKIVDSMF
jgi:hypothetical protein